MKPLILITLIGITLIAAITSIFRPFNYEDIASLKKDATEKATLVGISGESVNSTTDAPKFAEQLGKICSYEIGNAPNKQSINLTAKGPKLKAKISGVENTTIVKDLTIIAKDGWVYAWEDNSAVGTRFSETASNSSENYNPLKALNYETLKAMVHLDPNCTEQAVDDEAFKLPSNVQFKEFNVNAEEVKERLQEYCAKCEQAPSEEAKTACLQMLKCE